MMPTTSSSRIGTTSANSTSACPRARTLRGPAQIAAHTFDPPENHQTSAPTAIGTPYGIVIAAGDVSVGVSSRRSGENQRITMYATLIRTVRRAPRRIASTKATIPPSSPIRRQAPTQFHRPHERADRGHQFHVAATQRLDEKKRHRQQQRQADAQEPVGQRLPPERRAQNESCRCAGDGQRVGNSPRPEVEDASHHHYTRKRRGQ